MNGPKRKRIAVIGGGIGGLSTAWLLDRYHDVTLFEKNDYLGGHTHTVTVEDPGGPIGVDTGFVVYNSRNYPLLTELFRWLGVGSHSTDMSFSASIDDGRLEYAGSSLNTLFAQRRNLARPSYWAMLYDILRFNRRAKQALADGALGSLSVREYLHLGNFGSRLRTHYLLPMAAAIWSCPIERMEAFPAESLLRFFYNHGLLDLADRPRWKTVSGGSHSYVTSMLTQLRGTAHARKPVHKLTRNSLGPMVHFRNGQSECFDEIVLACHADEALALLDHPTPKEASILGSFQYQRNEVYLHSDSRLMPKSPKVWSSWNYLATADDDGIDAVSVTYWMNKLQGINRPRQFFVSLNPIREPRAQSVLSEMTYHHPVFDEQAISAQRRLREIQGTDRLWFCGSYTGYGFHEDALRSAVDVAATLGASLPWEQTRTDQAALGHRAAQPAAVT